MKRKILYIIAIILVNAFFITAVIFETDRRIKNMKPAYMQEKIVKTENAKRLFIDTWRLIKTSYYDPTLNHQDWYKWKNRYLPYIENDEDVYVAINSMLASLNDPYSKFMNKNEFEQQKINIDAKIMGIGVTITSESGKIRVVNVIENSPAQKAEMKADDVIFAVDGKEVNGMDLSDVSHMLRGEKGTQVNVVILRNKKKLGKTITRDEIKLKSVSSEMLDDEIGYIQIMTFISSDVVNEMLDAVSKTSTSKGLIIDLRGNTGGLLPAAISISNLFIEKGAIVSIVDRNGAKNTIDAQFSPFKIKKPIVILTDGATASASEIFSGAMKDYQLAVIVGEKTFGKGMIQKIFSLANYNGMNLTVGKYLTPNGIDINKLGIEPNYEVKITKNDIKQHKDPQLEKAKYLLKERLEHDATEQELSTLPN
ncbi:S41 family peptidase [bacterium]|nr:S41 family peptidase [bacterium]